MTPTKLLTIYPTAKTGSNPLPAHINIPHETQYLSIPETDLTASEIALLTSLYQQEIVSKPSIKRSPWHAFLTGETAILPSVSAPVRCIYFDVRFADNTQQMGEWLNLFDALFEGRRTRFLLTETSGVLVEEKTTDALTDESLASILTVLDSDFYAHSSCVIGSYYDVSPQLPAYFIEEKRLFQVHLQHLTGDSVVNIPKLLFKEHASQMTADSVILQQLKEVLIAQPDTVSLIKELWKNEGNIAHTAQKLFIHRNTLLYRIQRFYEQTGLSLKSNEALFLCYLLVGV
ncbi:MULTISPECIES: helix-turn-helix domain-containing protein [Brochothrix]|uniref:Putative transcriptional regulator (Regulates yxkF-msmX expression) n=1 Tax=Brochothrix thermosphacta TaxID=2756 RepID=A0A1D2LYM9_BROTH|nr:MULTISPECIES: helix-turn-helix domain-containing protein [Brochothrix]SLM90692.1 Leucine rich protein [Brachybacterium faecium]ANZ93929.1 hypothetical protein BFC19_00065 [Brochothrix thermosphacta]ANZ97766.1 hypothetical protein BFC20_08700 [Brochothrix thermosphacta]ATF24931.1 hypothetical protein CNY62_00270 [Brochothrix thermosphacta]ATH84346.1 hypothetical protein CPF12_00270 [Brochothrix thermosphacta]